MEEAIRMIVQQDEFLYIWFPDLQSSSYIIPTKPLNYINASNTDIGNVPIAVLKQREDCKSETEQEIMELDNNHMKIHGLFTKLKDKGAKDKVMVMMTQANFSMHNSLVAAASVSLTHRTSMADLLEIIRDQKRKYSDLIIVNKQRGVLVGVIQSVDISDHDLTRTKLAKSMAYLSKAAKIVQEVVAYVAPRADIYPVHKTVVLPNISRTQIGNLQDVIQSVPCLCRYEMVSDEALLRWWEACWTPGQRDVMESNIYKSLVAKFAIPSTEVEIFLTSQPRLQLKHEHDVVNSVGDIHGAEVFQAGLHQLSLFPTQAELLDYNSLDETSDDFKILWGPPGTGKTILLVLRALQWVKHFNACHVFILQMSKEGTAASCLIQYQLQQTLDAQQFGADTQSAPCTFTHVDLSGLWGEEWINETRTGEVGLTEEGKEKLSTGLGLQQRSQSGTAIHIVADEVDGDVVAAVYQWLKDQAGVSRVRLWAAGVEVFQDANRIPDSLQHVVSLVTEPLRCPGPVVIEVRQAGQIKEGKVPKYLDWHLTDQPAVMPLRHCSKGRKGHTEGPSPWRCGQCARNVVDKLRSLHVGEGPTSLSENDVFILASDNFDCDVPAYHYWSPAPLILVLRDNGFNVRTLSSASSRNDVLSVVRRDVQPPTIIVANDKDVRGLERKIVVYCDSVGGDTHRFGRLRAFSRTTSLLIFIRQDLSD